MFEADHTVYLSGPMSGVTALNFPKFFATEAVLRQHFPCKVLNPAKTETGLTYEQYLEIDLAMVRASSHILLLQGWENSHGASLEKAEAERLNKKIVHEMELMAHLTEIAKKSYQQGTL